MRILVHLQRHLRLRANSALKHRVLGITIDVDDSIAAQMKFDRAGVKTNIATSR